MEDVMRKSAALGAQGIGFDYFMLSPAARRNPAAIAALLDSLGLTAVLGFGMPLALPSAAFRLAAVQKKELFALARATRAGIVRVIGGICVPNQGRKPLHASLDRTAEIKNVAGNLARFAREAASEGITLALENHTEYTCTEMIEIIERAGHPSARVTLDTGNAAYLREDPVDTVARLAPFAVHTHIKDMRGTGPLSASTIIGQGEIDIPAILGILRNQNYSGLLAAEINLPKTRASDEETALSASLEYLRTLV